MSGLRVKSDTLIVPCFYCGRDCGQHTHIVRNSGVWGAHPRQRLPTRRPLTS